MADQATIQAIIDAVGDVYVVRYTSVATLSLLLYEYCLTQDGEIKLIWPSRLTYIKVLYFINRYLPILTTALATHYLLLAPNDTSCKAALTAVGVLSLLGFICAECILYVRAYAVWGHNKIVAAILGTVLVSATGAAFYVTIVYQNAAVLHPEITLPSGCVASFPNRIIFVNLIILVIGETLALSLLVLKSYLHFRHLNSSIMHMMLKDGVAYFACVLATTVTNMVILQLAPPELLDFLIHTQGTVHNILCNRLLLRIRGAYEPSAPTDASSTFMTRSGRSTDPKSDIELENMSRRNAHLSHFSAHGRSQSDITTRRDIDRP